MPLVEEPRVRFSPGPAFSYFLVADIGCTNFTCTSPITYVLHCIACYMFPCLDLDAQFFLECELLPEREQNVAVMLLRICFFVLSLSHTSGNQSTEMWLAPTEYALRRLTTLHSTISQTYEVCSKKDGTFAIKTLLLIYSTSNNRKFTVLILLWQIL